MPIRKGLLGRRARCLFRGNKIRWGVAVSVALMLPSCDTFYAPADMLSGETMRWSRVGKYSYLVAFHQERGEAILHNVGKFPPGLAAEKDNARRAIQKKTSCRVGLPVALELSENIFAQQTAVFSAPISCPSGSIKNNVR